MHNKKIIYIVNIFQTGAIPNILLDIIPILKNKYSYNIKILALQKIKDKNDKLIKKAQSENIEVGSLKMNRLDLLETYKELNKYLNIEKPDIIHSHLGRADIFSAFCKNKNSKLITTFHSIRTNYNLFTRFGYLITDKNVDLRTSVSKSVENSWYKDGHLKSRHKVIYNPINLNRLKTNVDLKEDYLSDFKINQNDFILLNIGRLIPAKGQIYLIRAMEKVIKHNQNIKLMIAGAGKLKVKLKKEINNLNLKNNVYLLGFRSDISELLKLSDVLVNTSEYEGNPISVLEGMAAQKPVLGSDIASIREIITNGEEGVLVKYNNPEKISEKILLLYKNKKLRNKIAINGYIKAKKLFSSKKIANDYNELYEEILLK